MHGLVALSFGVITFAIILLIIGLRALRVLVIASRAIVALVILMTIVGSAIVAVASVALMIVVILTTTMLMVAQFTAMHGRKMSHFLFFGCFLSLAIFLRMSAALSVA